MGAMDLQHIQYRELGKGLQVLAGRKDLAGIGDVQNLPVREEEELRWGGAT
jgi:hypothetical protein